MYTYTFNDFYDIISQSNKQCFHKGDNNMAYFQVNWNNYTEKLSKLAAYESWSNDTYPNNGILANYIVKTYEKLTSEKGIIIGQDYALFNTGLFTKYYEAIYAYQTGSEISFYTAYELSRIGIKERPERANYFENPELLLFDWHYPIDVYYKHILDDLNTSQRLPDSIKNSDRPLETLKGVIDTAIQKVIANYKLAVPHYYQNKIQLLVPLCFGKDDSPDVALVLDLMKNGYYQATTCLSMEMAYMDARLIAKPESNWLMAENIKE